MGPSRCEPEGIPTHDEGLLARRVNLSKSLILVALIGSEQPLAEQSGARTRVLTREYSPGSLKVL